MGLTITEKILAAHGGKREVRPGELITAKLDGVLLNDVSGPMAIAELKKMGYGEVFDRDRTYVVLDHFTPNANIKAAGQSKACRDFACDYGVTHFYDVGRVGIEHALLPEQGLVQPGQCIIGGDSHTCTYGALGAFATGVGSTDLAAGLATGELWFKVPESIRFVFHGALPPHVSGKDLILHTIGAIGVDGALYKAMEFTGSAIESLPMSGRFTMCNMAIEAGAKNGIVAPDEISLGYAKAHNRKAREFTPIYGDADAEYCATHEWDVSSLEPQVAFPHLPDKVKPVSAAASIAIQQVVIGSCTNGHLDDLRVAAAILKGRKVHPKVRCIIIPATQEIYLQAVREGLAEIFVTAGAAFSTPTCGPCFGGHMGILAEGERAISTTNRNFVGRMGHPKSEVYLSSPAVAAASAIAGNITHPKEFV